jgi:hypothetical protein
MSHESVSNRPVCHLFFVCHLFSSKSFVLSRPSRAYRRQSLQSGGGTGAVGIRAQLEPGTVKLTARHPRLDEQQVSFQLSAAPPESA